MNHLQRSAPLLTVLLGGLTLLTGCSNPQPGPDKTIGGMVLGAGWGAGAGAVIGNQVSYAGEGAAIGAGFGAVQGAMAGGGYDLREGALLEQERQLDTLKRQNIATGRAMAKLQDSIDAEISRGPVRSTTQVLFDADVTSLRSGAVAEVAALAEDLRKDPGAAVLEVSGHSDDGVSPEEALRISEARARSVAAVLTAHGIASGQIQVKSLGSTQPLASNGTPEGRQLNRRVEIRVRRRL